MSQNANLQPVSITILGKEYKIACSDSEQETLIHSARALDEQMREIRDSGKVNGTDRIAVMAALNLAHELNQIQNNNSECDLSIELTNLRHKIENIL